MPSGSQRVRGRDEGSVLVLVLVLMVIGALIVLPVLAFSTTVLRANDVVVRTVKREEAVKAALRVALAEPLRLYEHCYWSPTIGTPVVNDVSVHTSCELLASASAQEDHDLHLGVAVTKVDSVIPSGVTAVAILDEFENPTGEYYVYEQGPSDEQDARGPIDRWWNPAAMDPSPPYLAASLAESRRIWAPNLPSQPIAARTPTSFVMPPGYSSTGDECRVFFPGRYRLPLELSGDVDYFFTSGVYYFEAPITIAGDVDVVVGMGSTDGCTTDQEAAFLAVNAPAAHGISGLGATFVFGSDSATQTSGRLVVQQEAGKTPTVRFNQRYVHPTDVPGYASYGVSIISVNGAPDGAGTADLTIDGALSVPKSVVGGVELPYEFADGTFEPPEIPNPTPIGSEANGYVGTHYYPSALTYAPQAPTLDEEWAAGVQITPFRTSAANGNHGGLYVQWQDPPGEDWGGRPLRGYEVVVTHIGSGTSTSCTWGTWPPGSTTPPNDDAPRECTFVGLNSTSGTQQYRVEFRVRNGDEAENVSAPAEVLTSIVRSGSGGTGGTPVVPTIGPPTNIMATAYNGQIAVSWSAPPSVSVGGVDTPVSYYEVRTRDFSSAGSTGGSGTESLRCTVAHLPASGPACVMSGLSTSRHYRICITPVLKLSGSDATEVALAGTARQWQSGNPSGNDCWQTSSSYSLRPNLTGSAPAVTPPPDPPEPLEPVWPPIGVEFPLPVPDPIVHLDLSEDFVDGDCEGMGVGDLPALVEHMAAIDADNDVIVDIPGYVAVPQGLVQIDNPCARSRVTVTGGLLAADIVINGPPVPGGEALTHAIGIENPLVQRTFAITARTTSGTPLVRASAVVQVNETGEYVINSWEIQ